MAATSNPPASSGKKWNFGHPGGKELAVIGGVLVAAFLAYYLYKRNKASSAAASNAAASGTNSPTAVFTAWLHDHQGTSSSSGTITVPNVVGMTDTAGDAAITAAGLKVKDSNEKTGGSGGGTKITAQSPAAGSQVAPGSTVTLTLAAPVKTGKGGGDG